MKIARAKRAELLSFCFSLKSCIDATFFSLSSSWLLELSTVSGDGWSRESCMQVKECHDCVYSCTMQNTEVIDFPLQ